MAKSWRKQFFFSKKRLTHGDTPSPGSDGTGREDAQRKLVTLSTVICGLAEQILESGKADSHIKERCEKIMRYGYRQMSELGHGHPEIIPATEKLRQYKEAKVRAMIYIIGTDTAMMNFIGDCLCSEFNIKLFNDIPSVEAALRLELPFLAICENIPRADAMYGIISTINHGRNTSHIPVILIDAGGAEEEEAGRAEAEARFVAESEADEEKTARAACKIDAHIPLPFTIKELKAIVRELVKGAIPPEHNFRPIVDIHTILGERKLPEESRAFISKMLAIIRTNLRDTNLGVSFIADEMKVTRKTLCKVTEAITGITAADIIREYRLSYAEQLLRNSDLSVDEILYRAGFLNRGTFYRNFSEKYGMTPRNYRRSQEDSDL